VLRKRRLGKKETWKTRTALLLIQQGYQVFRRFQREKEQDQQLRFSSLQMLSKNSLQHPPVYHPIEFSDSPIDLS
jgi:positive regulator of sigma E activity